MPLSGGRISITVEVKWRAPLQHTFQRSAMKILKEFQHPMRKILIADDSELNARILTEILSIEGYDSEIAPDGDSAVSIFASSEPGEFSSIIIDIKMQQIDQWSAAGKIRKLHRDDSKTVKIYALTDSVYRDDSEYAKSRGLDGFLSDPLDVEELLFNLRRDIK